MSQNSNVSLKREFSTKDLVVSSLLVALVFIATYAIKFHLTVSLNSGGLVHTGNITLFAIAIVFGKRKGAIAGAFGMGLFDLVSGYVAWFPCTFIVRGIQGYIIGALANIELFKFESKVTRNVWRYVWYVITLIIAAIPMVAGYFIYNVFMTIISQDPSAAWSVKWAVAWTTAISSIPGDLLQNAIGIVGGLILVEPLIKIKKQILK